MKRTLGIHYFICFVLGMTVGGFGLQTIQNASIIYGVVTIIATIASVLNIACGPDKSINKE